MIRIKITKPNKVKIPLIIISAAAILFALLKPMSLDLKNAKTAITNDGTKKQIEKITSLVEGNVELNVKIKEAIANSGLAAEKTVFFKTHNGKTNHLCTATRHRRRAGPQGVGDVLRRG